MSEPGSRSRKLAGVLAAVASAIALFSAWHTVGYMRRILDDWQVTYAGLGAADHRRAPVAHVGLDGQMFDFFAAFLVRGDRVYFQVMPSGFSHNEDLPGIVEALGRYYFLPAVQTTNLDHATVVVSYFADPSLLHKKFITQVRAGAQPLWVSRISAP